MSYQFEVIKKVIDWMDTALDCFLQFRKQVEI